MENENSEESRNDTQYISLLSVISCIAVVILHLNGCFWKFGDSKSHWPSAVAIESIFYFAVPVFFMISGATLIDYMDRYSTAVFFRKRFVKTLIPFLFWSIMGLLVHLFFLHDITADQLSLKEIYNGIFSYTYVDVYWFFRPLFIIYLCMPLFAATVKEKRKEVFLYLFIAAFILDFLMPLIRSVFHPGIVMPLTTVVAGYYIIFIIAGYLISHYEVDFRLRILIYILGTAGFLMQSLGTYVYSMKDGAINQLFKGYTAVPAILQGLMVFMLGKTVGARLLKKKAFAKVIGFLKDYTFPVYLLHWFIIKGLLHFFEINTYSILWRIGGVIPVLIISILITAVLRKLHVGKWLLP